MLEFPAIRGMRVEGMPSEAAVIHEIAGVFGSPMRREVSRRPDDDEANGAREAGDITMSFCTDSRERTPASKPSFTISMSRSST